MSEQERRRAAWAYLSRVAQGPCAPLLELVGSVGVLEAARAVREWDLPAALRKVTAPRRHLDTAEHDLDLVARMGGRLITPDDDDWPGWRMLAFDPSARRPGERPGRECVAPLALWAYGTGSLMDLTERSIAIVGTRVPSAYGDSATADIAGDLAGQGWTIVSGAAFGIDAAAHRAALAVGAPTIAVLACGIDQTYPSGHARLLQAIADVGMVISEYPPGVEPAKYRFLARNRMVAALADAVVVVEAGNRSGARNTAGWARRLGRPALAVPGPVTSATSVGCHRMIREGEARLVTRASDVLDEAGPLTLPLTSDAGEVRATDRLSGNELLVYEAFPAVGTRMPRQLSEDSGVAIGDVRAVLPQLELAGFVGTDGAGWFRLAPSR